MCADRLQLAIQSRRGEFLLSVEEQIELQGVTAVFGPSGGGKSTLLRAIAGLDRVSGNIRWNDEDWSDSTRGLHVPAHQRPVGTLFQDARLFPHLDVAGNLRFASRRRRQDLSGFQVDSIVTAFDLGGLLNRRTHNLSGGERQRVAIARTLIAAPALLLLDEPLSGLDQERKAEIVPYLDSLQDRFDVPTLFVSHDIDEVAHLADRILVLGGGQVLAHGPTAEVLEHLDLEPVMSRFEAGVVLTGTVVDHEPRLHYTRVDLRGESLTVPMQAQLAPGATIRLRVRARDVAIAVAKPVGLSIRNVLPGTLDELAPNPQSGSADAWIDVSGSRIRARLTLAAVEELGLEPGMGVFALIKSVSFDPTH